MLACEEERQTLHRLDRILPLVARPPLPARIPEQVDPAAQRRSSLASFNPLSLFAFTLHLIRSTSIIHSFSFRNRPKQSARDIAAAGSVRPRTPLSPVQNLSANVLAGHFGRSLSRHRSTHVEGHRAGVLRDTSPTLTATRIGRVRYTVSHGLISSSPGSTVPLIASCVLSPPSSFDSRPTPSLPTLHCPYHLRL